MLQISQQLRTLIFLPVNPSVAVTSVRFIVRNPSYVHGNPLNQPKATKFRFSQKTKNPKFKRDRGLKFFRVELPDLNEKETSQLTPDELRAKMKEKGMQPVRPWNEKPMFVASTAATFEAYIPPEGDGKISVTSISGAKQKLELFQKKGKSMMSVRLIRQYDEDFEYMEFAEEAQRIYIESYQALAEYDEDKLHNLVTEKAYPLIVADAKHKTIKWSFLKSLEPPQVVHARTHNILTKDNYFAQVTVRFHTQQTLAVYDRFGRLQMGSEVIAKDVLEYVVFEKHLANTYGTWRIHDKIIPDWMPPKQSSIRTFRLPEVDPEPPKGDPETPMPEVKALNQPTILKDDQPALAPA